MRYMTYLYNFIQNVTTRIMNINKKILLRIWLLTLVFFILLIVIFPGDRKLEETSHRHSIEHTNTWDEIEGDFFARWDEDLSAEFALADELLAGDIHSAGWEERAVEWYNIVCNAYKDLCNKIERGNEYEISEKYAYTLMMVYLIRSIDDNMELDDSQTLRNTVSQINIYEHPKDRRWSAGATVVKINTQKIDNIREFWEVWTHEVWGHILDIWAIDDKSKPLHETFTEFGKPTFWLKDWSLKFYSVSRLDEKTRKKDSSYKDFVSGYAMRDIFEEFAEFANAWINHHDLLVEMTKTNEKLKIKYDLFSQLFGDRYFDADTDALRRFSPSERVFDTTKEWKS